MNQTHHLPSIKVGVFDSGVGGLTVAEKLYQQLPALEIHYFGDTAHVPYGERSRDEVRFLVGGIARHLVRQGAQALVLACNTSSALALDSLKEEIEVPIVGIIEAAARAAAELTRQGRVGVLCNALTAKSGAYQRAVRRFSSSKVRVKAIGCPRLVPLIESGVVEGPVARAALLEYLAPLQEMKVDTLILGCTHYPFMAGMISKLLGPEVRLVDPADYVVRELVQLGCPEGGLQHSNHRTEVSGCPSDFELNASRLLGRLITGVQRRELVRYGLEVAAS